MDPLLLSYFSKTVGTFLLFIAALSAPEGHTRLLFAVAAYLSVAIAWSVSTRIARRAARLEEGCNEALAYFRNEWNTVGNHPASRHLREIEYFEEILGKS